MCCGRSHRRATPKISARCSRIVPIARICDVTTDLQTFGLIVTAEPYAAVRQPSNVVVMENEIRPDTVGKVQAIQAKYELLPRGHYTYEVPKDVTASASNGEKLPMDRYESLLEVYQAQNAVQIARAQGADKYAADTFARAEQSLKQAQDFYARKVDRSTVVTAARQAAQTAEDARAIAIQKKHDEELAQARSEAAREQQLRMQAEADAQRARAELSASRTQPDRDHVGAADSRTGHCGAGADVLPGRPPVCGSRPPRLTLRKRSSACNSCAISRPRCRRAIRRAASSSKCRTSDFRGGALSGDAAARLARVASVLASQPNLYIAIEGNSDTAAGERLSEERAMAVRDALLRGGAPSRSMSARGLGNSRPMASNESASGRTQNRRVEITISGDPIGSTPYWERSYSIAPRQ